MLSLLLAAAGVLFALLFAANTLLQSLRRRARVGFVHTLLAFLAALLTLAALVADQLAGTPDPQTGTLALAAAALAAGAGLVVIPLELRRPERLKNSRGVLGLGVGALAAAAVLAVPPMAGALLITPTPDAPLLVSPAPDAANTQPPVQAEPSATPSPAPTTTPLPTRTPPPSRTPRPTLTLPLPATRTPTPTPTLPPSCGAVVNYNLNLRAAPLDSAPVLLTIPFDSVIALYGRSADSGWWFVIYDGQEGWVNGAFITPDTACAALPVRPG